MDKKNTVREELMEMELDLFDMEMWIFISKILEDYEVSHEGKEIDEERVKQLHFRINTEISGYEDAIRYSWKRLINMTGESGEIPYVIESGVMESA